MVAGRGQVEPDEELLEDGVAFAGVAKYPARVKCALLPWMAFKDALVRARGGECASDRGRAERTNHDSRRNGMSDETRRRRRPARPRWTTSRRR